MKIALPFHLMTAALVCIVAVSVAQARPASSATPDAAMTVPSKALAANQAYWKKLGVTPPAGGFVLAHPWSRPWSGRSLVVPIAWLKQARASVGQHIQSGKPMMVNAAALRADLPILHLALQKNYSGWEMAAKKGWDWNHWFKQWNAMLAGYGDKSIPGSKAFAPWAVYEKFQIDSHSGPSIPSRSDVYSKSALLSGTPHAACTRILSAGGTTHTLDSDNPAQQPHAVKNWNGNTLKSANYIVYPSSYGTVKSLVCGKQTIAVTPFWNPHGKSTRPIGAPPALKRSVEALSGGKARLAAYNTLAPGIGYLRLAAFVDAGDEAFAKLLKKLPASAGHEKILIVDLRHNGGGNAPIDLMSRWLPVKQITSSMTKTAKRSCLYPGLWFNLGQFLAMQVKPPVTNGFRETMAAYAKGLDTPASDKCPVSFKRTQGAWGYTDHHFVRHWQGQRPRLLVLVDNQCGSDCEYMTWMLAQLPGTVVAGENTYGVIGFTQPGVLLLPHTRVAFFVATSYSDGYGDGRSSNGYGLDVDIALPAQADWSKRSILALAEKLIEPSRHESL